MLQSLTEGTTVATPQTNQAFVSTDGQGRPRKASREATAHARWELGWENEDNHNAQGPRLSHWGWRGPQGRAGAFPRFVAGQAPGDRHGPARARLRQATGSGSPCSLPSVPGRAFSSLPLPNGRGPGPWRGMRERALRALRANTSDPSPERKTKLTLDWKLCLLHAPPPARARDGPGGEDWVVKGGWLGSRTDGEDRCFDGSEQNRPITNDTMAKRNKRRFLYDG